MLKVRTESGRSRPLHHIFTTVPRRYDLINRIVTWGLDRRWRTKAAKKSLASNPKRILDLGCGTGDLAMTMATLADGAVELIGVDYSLPMLELAKRKTAPLASGERLFFIYGDAADLPFRDGDFDCVATSFAFRNLTYKNPLSQRYLGEVLRVLSPGGRFIIVESSQPKTRLIRKLFHLYLRWFVFRIGYQLSGNRGAYHYLAESASRFYTPEELGELLRVAGFRQVSCQPLSSGVVSLCVAVK